MISDRGRIIKKIVKRTLIIAPIVIVIGLVAVYLSLGVIVRSAAREVLPRVTGVPCEIERVSIDLLGGRVSIEGLIIGNPEGYNTDSAFQMSNVIATFSLKSVLLSDTIRIQEIMVDKPMVTYELGVRGSNLGDIKRHAESMAEKREVDPDAEPGKRVEIDRFAMKGAIARIASRDIGLLQATVPIPDIELKDIGKDKRLDVYAAADQIFTVALAFTDGAVGASDRVISELRDLGVSLEGLGDGALEDARRLVDEGRLRIDEGRDLIEEGGRGLIDRLRRQPE